MSNCHNCNVFCGLSFVTIHGIFCPKCFRELNKDGFKQWLKNGEEKDVVKTGKLNLTGEKINDYVITKKEGIMGVGNADIS